MRDVAEMFLKASEYKTYYKLDETLHSMILLQDEIDDRFVKNEYVDLIACTLLYHQMVEKFMYSLIEQGQFRKQLFYGSPKRYKNKADTFSTKCNLLRMVVQDGYFFEESKTFIKMANKLNRIRNEIAHSAIRNDKEKIIFKLNEVKENYHKLQEIYQRASVKTFDDVIEWMKSLVNSEQDYSCDDLEKIRAYILDNTVRLNHYDFQFKLVVEMFGKINFLINNEEPADNLPHIIEGYDYGFATLKDILEELKLKK